MQHRGLRWLKWASLLVAVGSMVAALLLLWSGEPDQLAADTNLSKKPNTEVDAPVIVERKDGHVLWQLRAIEASQQLDGNMHLTKPQLKLYTDAGQEIRINADQAWFNPLDRNVHFKGDVTTTYDQWILNSQALNYDSGQDRVIIPEQFDLQGDSLKAHGKHLIFARDSGKVDVLEGISIEDSNPQWQGVKQL